MSFPPLLNLISEETINSGVNLFFETFKGPNDTTCALQTIGHLNRPTPLSQCICVYVYIPFLPVYMRVDLSGVLLESP